MQRNGSMMVMISPILLRPDLWLEAVRAGVSISKRRRVPTLLPDRDFLEWRLGTVYGDAPFVGEDLVRFLEWRKRQRSID